MRGESIFPSVISSEENDEPFRCHKAVVIAVATDDRVFSVVKAENVRLDIDAFTKFFEAEVNSTFVIRTS